ncbi:MAG TPA: zf-HC2 domain-containing protein [Actinomycetota bacterium]|nr:zf-HC2 domain-containing protein [Actinomycetota bacterium]
MNDHPEELLAEYVDGSLAADDRATVEAHLASCSLCADEVAVAEQARMFLTELPEVPVPFGTEQRILQRTRGRARWESPFAWRAARVAAVAAAVVGVGTAVFLGSLRGSDEELAPEAGRQAAEEPAQDAAVAPEPSSAEGALGVEPQAAFPAYKESQTNYTSATLTTSVRRFADEARAALDQGFPPTAREFYGGESFSLLVEPALKAVDCVNNGVPPDRTVVPFIVEAASFEKKPAYLVVYLRGPDADTPYDRIQVVVVDRESCGVLHFARQNL